jgi:hypothetical protein
VLAGLITGAERVGNPPGIASASQVAGQKHHTSYAGGAN